MGGDIASDCFICRKHRDRGALVSGGFVAEDDLSHVAPPDVLGGEGTSTYLRYSAMKSRTCMSIYCRGSRVLPASSARQCRGERPIAWPRS
jgi:hypothetical protein